MTTYTATERDLRLALAEILDWQTAPADQYDTFSDLVVALVAHLTEHRVNHPAGRYVSAAEECASLPYQLSADTLARLQAAGRELGRIHGGQPVPPPPDVLVRYKAESQLQERTEERQRKRVNVKGLSRV